MRTMYDALNAAGIPADAEMVAGYIDAGPGFHPWSAEDWARFPDAVQVRIATQPATNDGDVLDVEAGDADPSDVPGWLRARRSVGAWPSLYCSESIWPYVRRVVSLAGLQEPPYWIAGYPGSVGAGNLYDGSVAHQYVDVGPYDLSCVADYWPGVDSRPTPAPIRHQSREHPVWVAFIAALNYCDVWYAGVLVDGFKNDDQPNEFNVGHRFQHYLDQGVPWTAYPDEQTYNAARARLLSRKA